MTDQAYYYATFLATVKNSSSGGPENKYPYILFNLRTLIENKIFNALVSQHKIGTGPNLKLRDYTVTSVKEGYESLQSLIIFSSFRYFYREK